MSSTGHELNFHEEHRHYRNSATALSLTTLAITGALLLEIRAIQFYYSWAKPTFFFAFAVVALCAYAMQYLNFRGYQAQARWLVADIYHSNLTAPDVKYTITEDVRANEVAKVRRDRSQYERHKDKCFDWLDYLTDATTLLAVIVSGSAIIAIVTH
jgi:hypothetical protein